MQILKDKIKFDQIPDSFAERHITIREDLGENIFLTQDNGRGVVYEFPGIYDEPLTLEGKEGLLGNFSVLYKSLIELARGIPDNQGNVTIQFFCSQRELSKAPPKIIDGREINYSNSGLGKILDQYEKDLFETIKPIKRKFYLAIHWQPARSSMLSDLARSSLGLILPEKKQANELEQMFESSKREFRDRIKAFELEVKPYFDIRRIESKELIGYIQNILHCGRPQKVYDRSSDIHQAIYNPKLENKRDGLYWEDKSIKAFVLHNATEPRQFSFGLLRHFIDSIPLKNWDLVWCFTDGTHEARPNFTFSKIWYSWAGGGEDKVADFENFEKSIGHSRPYGTQSLRLLAYDTNESQESIIKSAATNFLNARMLKEEEVPIHIISTSLPLNLRKEWHKVKGITREIRLWDATSYWPVFDGPPAKEGSRWLISRTGSPTCYDPFSGYGLRTTAILGQARAGKSSLTNLMLSEFLDTQNGIARGIDVRTSYKKPTEICGGRIVDFSVEALIDNPFNPFAGVDSQDEAEMNRLINIILTAIHLANKGIRFDTVHDEILRQSVARAFKTHATTLKTSSSFEDVGPHPIWQDVLSELEPSCEVLKSQNVQGIEEAKSDLVKWGLSLSEGGKFGYLFSQYETGEPISPETKLVIYDIGDTDDSKEEEQILATQIAAARIKRDISYDFGKSIPKMVILEEFGLLVNGKGKAAEYMSSFAADIVKSGPKTNTFVVAVTNSVEDYTTKVGKSLWGNASQKIFLPMGSAMVKTAREAWGEEEFNDAEWQIIDSLVLQKHKQRSMAYIKSKIGEGFQGSVFLPLTPIVDALITTNDNQKKFYDRLRTKGYSPVEAIEYMANHHPFGEGVQ